jgi:DNA mismatch repair ATPase MutS
MNVFLMFRDRDFDEQAVLPWNQKALEEDLGLEVLYNAMARQDAFLLKMVKKAVLLSLQDVQEVRYRQGILSDCIKNPEVIQELYGITLEAIRRKRESWFGGYSRYYPSSILHSSVELLYSFTELLRQLRTIAEQQSRAFHSEGFSALFAMLRKELSEEYLAVVLQYLKELRLSRGALVSARLGEGNKGTDYVLRRPNQKQAWLKRVLSKAPLSSSFRIADRDESGARILSELKGQGLNQVANALAQSAEHVVSFFTMLRTELAFYIGCLNLHEALAQRGQTVCLPEPVEKGERVHSFRGLYDPSLALTMDAKVIGSDVDVEEKELAFITGANQGGKSTFLRSIGIAQVMMQCGMFVPAKSLRANLCSGLFTHYARKEDPTMSSGKFDEELGRMSEIVDHVRQDSLILFNESFSATNEREGSEIARQVVAALLDKRVKVFFVTHMYELARGFYEGNAYASIFLRPGRLEDGTRTFKIGEGEPQQTSYGRDLYERIFSQERQSRAVPAGALSA